MTPSARQRARAIHAFMHAHILRGRYEARASDLAGALAGGAYNCAASSALFLALAREFGLEAQAVSVAGHVWCRVTSHGERSDVETTCPEWFEVLEQADAAAGSDSAVWREHCARAAQARALDEHAFLAVFHFNRGVALYRQRQFVASAAANLTAISLDPACAPARENLAASLARCTSERIPN
jgi:hypothetical protein